MRSLLPTALSSESENKEARRFGRIDLLLLSMVLIWGVNFPVVKGALAEMQPLAFNALRFISATILLYLLVRLTGQTVSVHRPDLLGIALLGLLGNGIYQLLFISGIAFTTATNSSLILAMVPITVAIMGAALRLERIPWWAWVGIALSFTGLCLLILGNGVEDGQAQNHLVGDLLVFAAMMCWSAYTILSKPYVRRYSTLSVTVLSMASGAGLIFLASLPSLFSQNWAAVSQSGWLGLIFSSVFAIALGYLAWFTGVRAVGSARTAIYSNFTPVVTLVSSALLLGESLRPSQLIGAFVILIGIVLTHYHRG
ncbi:MAG: DMT family transporter [Chloroflexi bacterium]|nr:DMT family transporter [Chloroflexota bacterium]